MSASSFYVGCHLSVSKGFLAMGETAVQLGATTLQFFTRNPRGGAAKDWEPDDVAAFRQLAEKHGFGPCVAHAPYTLNACAADAKTLDFARRTMADDLRRLEAVPGCLYNFHPGSHVGQGVEAGVALIAETLNEVMTPEQNTLVLLETMAGKGSEVGGNFAELRDIMDKVKLRDKLGVCLDTCHVYDSGLDIRESLEQVLADFDAVIGLEHLHAVHVNDSMFGLASHKDRHACLGEGKLGLEAITAVINHPRLRQLPFVLETPNDLDGYAREIALLKQARKG